MLRIPYNTSKVATFILTCILVSEIFGRNKQETADISLISYVP